MELLIHALNYLGVLSKRDPYVVSKLTQWQYLRSFSVVVDGLCMRSFVRTTLGLNKLSTSMFLRDIITYSVYMYDKYTHQVVTSQMPDILKNTFLLSVNKNLGMGSWTRTPFGHCLVKYSKVFLLHEITHSVCKCDKYTHSVATS